MIKILTIATSHFDTGGITRVVMNYYKHLEIDTGIDERILELEKLTKGIYATEDQILDLSLLCSL